MPTVDLERTYTAEAAHWLPSVPMGHKCGRMHGHSYRITITVTGELGADGMVMDFADIDAAARPLVDTYLDHHLLNDVVPNPTSEHIAIWLWRVLQHRLTGLAAVAISETCRSACTYRGGAA